MRNEIWVNRCIRKFLVFLDLNVDFGIIMWILERKLVKYRFIESNWIWKGSRVFFFSMKKVRVFMMIRGILIVRCIVFIVFMLFIGVEEIFIIFCVWYKDFNDSIGSVIFIFIYGLMFYEVICVKIYVYVCNI